MNALTLFLTVFCFCSAPSRAQSPTLSGIAHVAFRVNDLRASREFYRTLGFEQAFEFHDPGKAAVAFIKLHDRQFIELRTAVRDLAAERAFYTGKLAFEDRGAGAVRLRLPGNWSEEVELESAAARRGRAWYLQ